MSRRNTVRAISTLAILMGCAAGLPLAAQDTVSQTSPQPTHPNREPDMFEQLIERAKKGESLQVDPRRAMICEVCGHPYFKHSEDNFVCEPQDGDLAKIQWVRVKCPLTGRMFEAAKQGNINDHGGMDRDLCRHSLGKSTVYSSVWMCPETGYAAPAERFGQEIDGSPLGPRTVKLVQEKLMPATREIMLRLVGLTAKDGKNIPPELLKFNDYVKQTGIPDWLMYENALTLMENSDIKVPHSVLAKYHLEAAHANRREVASEVSVPAMHPQLQISLGKSIRKMNNFISGAALEVRQERKETVLNPLKSETNPEILVMGTARLIERAQRVVQLDDDGGPRAVNRDRSPFTVADMFVLYTEQAGHLDRLGDIDGAMDMLRKALKAVPQNAVQAVDPETEKVIGKNMNLLRAACEERLDCLERERTHLYKAADELMQALYFGEAAAMKNHATNAYLIAELLRRDGRELESAQAWFDAAEKLVAVEIRKLGAQESKEKKKREALLGWILAQRDLMKGKVPERAPHKNVLKAIDKVLASTGGGALPLTPPAPPETAPKPPASGNGDTPPADPKTQTAPEKAPAPPATTAKDRTALLEGYYSAFTRYHAKHKALPEELDELIKEGFLEASAASLNEKGKIVCPESGKKLLYQRNVTMGKAADILIFPLPSDPVQLKLFADGRIAAK